MRLNVDGGKIDRSNDAWLDSAHEAAHYVVATDFGWDVQLGRYASTQPGPVALFVPRVLRRSRSGARQAATERFIILLAGAATSEDVQIDVPESCNDDIAVARRIARQYHLDESISDGMRIARMHTRRLWPRIIARADVVCAAYLEAKGNRR